MTKILVVEDEEMISQLIEDFLTENGYTVTVCFDGVSALNIVKEENFDLVILDVMLPQKNGLEVLKEIRTFSQVPIIMLTAMTDEQTQLISYNYQIDDYVPKPFSPTVLVKRIENVLRRYKKSSFPLELGELKMDTDNCEVFYKNSPIFLTKKEFDILSCLIRNKNRILTREQIIDYAWGYDEIVNTRIIDNHIRTLRKKIPGIPIITLKGIGFKMGTPE